MNSQQEHTIRGIVLDWAGTIVDTAAAGSACFTPIACSHRCTAYSASTGKAHICLTQYMHMSHAITHHVQPAQLLPPLSLQLPQQLHAHGGCVLMRSRCPPRLPHLKPRVTPRLHRCSA